MGDDALGACAQSVDEAMAMILMRGSGGAVPDGDIAAQHGKQRSSGGSGIPGQSGSREGEAVPGELSVVHRETRLHAVAEGFADLLVGNAGFKGAGKAGNALLDGEISCEEQQRPEIIRPMQLQVAAV